MKEYKHENWLKNIPLWGIEYIILDSNIKDMYTKCGYKKVGK